MKIFKYILLLLILSIVMTSQSCKRGDAKTPENVIVKDKMISIMLDINLVESSLRMNPPRNMNDSLQIKSYYKVIFKKYKVTKTEFDKSVEYYSKHPEKFGEIYDEIISRLSRMQSEEPGRK